MEQEKSKQTAKSLPALRKDTEKWLLGQPIESFPPNRLPTNRQCLLRLLHIQNRSAGVRNLSLQTAAYNVVDEAATLYNKIPVKLMRRENARDKVVKLYNDWRNLGRSKARDTPGEQEKRNVFSKN